MTRLIILSLICKLGFPFNLAFQETSIRNQLLLQQQVAELNDLVLRNLSTAAQINLRPEGAPKWPLQTLDDLFVADSYLEDEENFSNEVSLKTNGLNK